jgi:LPS O-antigen subunit length determinant protein (WzzB/FepE family)
LTFFEQQVDYAAARLAVASEQLQRDGGASLPKRMELEVLQSSYKQLLAKREEARMARDLNSRSLGERFRALDPANLPQEPVGPTRLELTLIGGTLGLLVAWIIVTADIVRRSLKNRREFMPATN